MPAFDPANDQTGASGTKLVVRGGKPSVAELIAAISASTVAASYPAAALAVASKNDLIFICRSHGIDVPGLPGDADFPVVAPTIATQPANVTKSDGQTATFTVIAQGSATLTYQWQRQVHGAGAWSDVGGGTSASLDVTAHTADSTDKYRVVVRNSVGTVTSSGATLTVS